MTQIHSIQEDQIRPQDLFAEFVRLCIEDAQGFFHETEMEEISCPGCGSKQHAPDSFMKHGFHYAHCGECGSLYASTRPSKQALLRYYASSKSQLFWSEVLLEKTKDKRLGQIMLPALERAASLCDEYSLSPNSIIDVGCSNGGFLTAWKERFPDVKCYGIEPGENAARISKEAGITVYEGFVEDPEIRQNATADLVTCFEVFEHVQDPNLFARAIYDITEPGGSALLSCLGCDGFDIQTLWDKSHSISPPYHLNFISETGLKYIFTSAGFADVTIISPGRLDVRIVQRMHQDHPEISLGRFEKLLLSKGEDTLQAFQTFLAENRLSSHVWILARKAA